MDNASKALVMAGAILIAVMLISLGVLLYNRATEVATSSLDSVAAVKNNADNQQWATYLGAGKSSSNATSLLDSLAANNSNSETLIAITATGTVTTRGAGGATSDTSLNVSKDTKVATIRTLRNTIANTVNSLYTVEVADYYADGHIKELKITGSKKS